MIPWVRRLKRDSFVEQLAALHRAGMNDDSLVDREVRRVLSRHRWNVALAPYLRIFREIWRITYGGYRRARQKIHGGTAQASSASTGATVTYSTVGNPANFAPSASPPTGPGLPFEDAGIRAGEVIAYRCWRLKQDGLLYSCYRDDFVWEPGKPAEGKPAEFGEGVHGFKGRLSACQYLGDWEQEFMSGVPNTIVSGTVELWGDVFEHQRGYRASHAMIASIDDSPHYDAAKLRRKYKIAIRKNKK